MKSAYWNLIKRLYLTHGPWRSSLSKWAQFIGFEIEPKSSGPVGVSKCQNVWTSKVGLIRAQYSHTQSVCVEKLLPKSDRYQCNTLQQGGCRLDVLLQSGGYSAPPQAFIATLALGGGGHTETGEVALCKSWRVSVGSLLVYSSSHVRQPSLFTLSSAWPSVYDVSFHAYLTWTMEILNPIISEQSLAFMGFQFSLKRLHYQVPDSLFRASMHTKWMEVAWENVAQIRWYANVLRQMDFYWPSSG